MAPLFLDGRTSQNASTLNSILIPTTSSYVLFGQVGLIVTAANESIPIRAQLNGIITLKLSSSASNFANFVEIKIVRGTDPNATAVFSGIATLIANGDELGPQEYSFAVADFNAPKGTGLLVYSVFVRNTTGNSEADVTRVGPESFNVIAIGN